MGFDLTRWLRPPAYLRWPRGRGRAALVVLTALALLGAAAAFLIERFSPEEPAAPSIQLDSVVVGPSIVVSVEITGESVQRAELWADDVLLARETNPDPRGAGAWPIVWRWEPQTDGPHGLAVRAFDAAGRYGAQMLFTVVVPPRGEIVFSSNREGRYALYVVTADGSGVRRLSPPSADGREPAPGAGGSLAFASQRGGKWGVWLQSAGRTHPLNLTPDLAWARGPVWSPDHTRLAFSVSDNGQTNIYLMTADGSGREQLTRAQSADEQPTWSPSGDQVAFASERDDEWSIYRIRTDGTGLVKLTDDGAQNWQPAWSPRGDRIAFVSNRSGTYQIYEMNSDGSSPVRLTDFPQGAEQPAWSADGRWLAFAAYQGYGEGVNRREIFLMFADGRGLVRLTQNDFDDTEPSWRP